MSEKCQLPLRWKPCKHWQSPASISCSVVLLQRRKLPFCSTIPLHIPSLCTGQRTVFLTTYNILVHISRMTFLLPALTSLRAVQDIISLEEQVRSTDQSGSMTLTRHALCWILTEWFSYSYESFNHLIQLICTHNSQKPSLCISNLNRALLKKKKKDK